MLPNRYKFIKYLESDSKSRTYLYDDTATKKRVIIREIVTDSEEYVVATKLKEAGCHMMFSCVENMFTIEDKRQYIVYEYFEGAKLSDVVGDVSEDLVFKLAGFLISGLSYLHSKNIIHRDFVLDNILFNKESMRTNIIGFVNSCWHYCPGKSRGFYRFNWPPEYPPCDVKPQKDISPDGFKKADVYALGIALYELAIGKIFDECPYTDKALQKIKGGQYVFPDKVNLKKINLIALREFIRLCLEPNPKKRLSSKKLVQIYTKCVYPVYKKQIKPKLSPKKSLKVSPKRSPTSIKHVPVEVTIDILMNLPPRDLKKMCLMNKEYADICRDSRFRKQYSEKWLTISIAPTIKHSNEELFSEDKKYITEYICKKGSEDYLDIILTRIFIESGREDYILYSFYLQYPGTDDFVILEYGYYDDDEITFFRALLYSKTYGEEWMRDDKGYKRTLLEDLPEQKAKKIYEDIIRRFEVCTGLKSGEYKETKDNFGKILKSFDLLSVEEFYAERSYSDLIAFAEESE